MAFVSQLQLVADLPAASMVFTALLAGILLLLLVSKKLTGSNGRTSGLPLPPSPPGLPVVGHLHLLGPLPHRSLRALSGKYGPVIHLRLGRVPTVVACSAAAAEEAMKARDLAFASRPRLAMVDRFYYGSGGIGFAPYGEHWRQARCVCVTRFLNNNPRRVASLSRLRRQEAAALVARVRAGDGDEGVVNLSDSLIVYSNTVISRAIFGGDAGFSRQGGERMRKAFAEIEELLGTAPMAETVPWLRWVDVLVTGLEAKTRRAFQEMDALLDRVIADHRKKRRRGLAGAEEDDDEDRDFVDVLLEEYGGGSSEEEGAMKGIILDMLAAATDSTFTLLEWAMAELINHPDKMLKLQHEIRHAVARSSGSAGDGGAVTEEHLPELPYLKAVVRETLRLHPPTPLLLPRETRQDTELQGYAVPKGTRVLVHAWAIARDPAAWGADAEEFVPERFLGYDDGELLQKKKDFAFLPFGAGRRGCPGVGFAMPSNELALASLVYSFDWELPPGDGAGGREKKVDMSELHGLSVRLKTPLLLVAKPYDAGRGGQGAA